jgi:hypothetical protein
MGMKLSGHYIILQYGVFLPQYISAVTGFAGKFCSQERASQEVFNSSRRLRENPRKAAVCAERCTDETVSLTASRNILHRNNWIYKDLSFSKRLTFLFFSAGDAHFYRFYKSELNSRVKSLRYLERLTT